MQINFSFGTLTVFDWTRNKSDLTSQTKKQPPRPAQIDYREYPVANYELTYGLYHNSFPGMKLAGALAYTPIAVPVSFMGIPIPVTEDKDSQEEINDLVSKFVSKMKSVHTQSHREGTIWIWPFFDSQSMTVMWEFIPDESVSDIIIDINTKQITKLIVSEQVMAATGDNEHETATRKRIFTRQKITETWDGQGIPGAVSRTYRNPVGVLPIPFANNREGNYHRGHSDYERIIPDLKDYADIDYRQSSMLAKFTVKMIQEFATTAKEWLDNNGYENDITNVDVNGTDFIMNKAGEEKTTFTYLPQGAYDAAENAMKRKFRKIVEGSGVPELLWGVKIEGNHASAEEQMDAAVLYIKGKQTQHNESYFELFTASFQLLQLAGQIQAVPEIEIKWNELSAVSEKVKAEIFNLFASGVSSLITSAGITKKQLHSLWQRLYPHDTEDDFEEFIMGMSDMASHRQFTDSSYAENMNTLEGEI